MNKFYVYVHKYASGPKIGEVFYVGKGKGERCLDKRSRNRWWKSICKKYGFEAEILAYFKSEKCAFSFERAFISFFGRENLCNLTDGGDGVKSFIPNWRVRVYSSLGEEFDSMKHAAVFLRANGYHKANSSGISAVCDNFNKFAYGRAWSRSSTPSHKKVRTQKEVAAENFRTALSKPVMSSVYGKFNSVMDATRHMKTIGFVKARAGNISASCRGERKTAYGSEWKYI